MATEKTPVTARGADPAAPRVGTGSRVARAIDGTLKVIVTSAVLYELAALEGNVLSRQLFDSPVYWAQELTPLALTTIAFLGGAMAYRRGAHAFLHVFIDALPQDTVCRSLSKSDIYLSLGPPGPIQEGTPHTAYVQRADAGADGG